MQSKIEQGQIGLGFHGSAQHIDRFTDHRCGVGGDANSAMGLFMSHVPMNALEYALNANELGEGEEVHVYVVAFPRGGSVLDITPDEYYGRDASGNALLGREHFQQMRIDLVSKGFDQISCETGEDAVTVSLHPGRCQIIACLTQEQVEALDAQFIDCLDYAKLYQSLGPYLSTPSMTKAQEESTYEYR